MYRKGDSLDDFILFDRIWTRVWQQQGFELEFTRRDADCYLILSDDGEVAGTVEFKRYDPGRHPIDALAPFSEHPALAPGNAVEVDKVALLPEYRGRNLDKLISLIVHYCENRGRTHIVALMEPKLCKALRMAFRIKLERIAEPFHYKGGMVVPVVCDVSRLYLNKPAYGWLLPNPEQPEIILPAVGS
ncbi:N-acetyltransferase [Paenibacillus chitinolyticus]|uniref:N-acetyltransferase n=1 Tax=Paenibacillus chitinolyticus TaxID=79263 RepID=A0A410X2W0_9BACL|nr:GNAT family N-acetyltransferase [Paenibacillus chitinolyticus]MCY9593790.1 GNAT family N-acetyltransferase [Paenibacillus chitinolyticus]MCY9599295.1 GNAT family N-acetyltransferase [Paenibacillus chitinolyticus]QAV20946.1 N-acetyltransferase [Paenibacillus chitinolyticus]